MERRLNTGLSARGEFNGRAVSFVLQKKKIVTHLNSEEAQRPQYRRTRSGIETLFFVMQLKAFA